MVQPSPATAPIEVGSSSDHGEGEDDSTCDLRLLFVSGTGLAIPRDVGNDGGKLRGGEVDTTKRVEDSAVMDLGGVIGREMWRPWPQADVVVHTGSQASHTTEQSTLALVGDLKRHTLLAKEGVFSDGCQVNGVDQAMCL